MNCSKELLINMQYCKNSGWYVFLANIMKHVVTEYHHNYYVGMTQVQNGVLYIGYSGMPAKTSEKQDKKPID